MMKPTVSDFLSMLSPGLAQKVTGLFSVVPYPICGSHKQHVVSRETDGGWAGARDRESMDSPGEQGKKKSVWIFEADNMMLCKLCEWENAYHSQVNLVIKFLAIN